MKNRKQELEPYIDIEKIEEIIYNALKDAIDSGELSSTGKPLFFSISMKIEPDGKAMVESFGNMASLRKMSGANSEKSLKEIFAEVIESEKEFVVTLELPFAREDDLNVRIFETKIIVSGLSPECFYKQVVLEKPVAAEKAVRVFKNGILEIILPKKV